MNLRTLVPVPKRATAALVAVVLIGSTAAQPVRSAPPESTPSEIPLSFVSEVIRMTVEPDSLVVEGTYHLSCGTTTETQVPLLYPYPRDERLGGARTVLLEARSAGGSWTPLAINEISSGAGARWGIPVESGQEVEVRTIYKQALKQNYACYIVTTTQAWQQPLQRARFEIRLPPGAQSPKFSYPFMLRELEDGSAYVFETRGFLPKRDITVEWKDSGD